VRFLRHVSCHVRLHLLCSKLNRPISARRQISPHSMKTKLLLLLLLLMKRKELWSSRGFSSSHSQGTDLFPLSSLTNLHYCLSSRVRIPTGTRVFHLSAPVLYVVCTCHCQGGGGMTQEGRDRESKPIDPTAAAGSTPQAAIHYYPQSY
jgi:hypothetical protein